MGRLRVADLIAIEDPGIYLASLRKYLKDYPIPLTRPRPWRRPSG